MKILITYYSRTGTTKKLAQALAERTGAEIEEIRDVADRKGAGGYWLCGKEATLRRLTKLEEMQSDPASFDLVIVGTPIWSWNLSSPVRTFLEAHKSRFKRLAFFCTMGGSGAERAKKEAEKIVGRSCVATLGVTTTEVAKNRFTDKLEKFLAELGNPDDLRIEP